MDKSEISSQAKSSAESKPKIKLPFDINAILFFLRNIFASTQNVIGIDIGTSYIKIAQLQKGPKGYTITNCITRAIPQTVKENSAEKRKLIQEFVKQFVTDVRVKTKLGRIIIWGKGVYVFSLTVPALKKKDLRGAVSIELKKRLPFQADINSVSFDFFTSGEIADEGGVSLLVTCIAADQFRLDEEVRFLKDMNMRPVAINVTPDALGNLVFYCIEGAAGKIIILLELGASSSQLNFYKTKTLVFSREIPIGGDHLTQALFKGLSAPQQGAAAAGIGFDDAEKIKRNCGIPLEDEARTEYITDFGTLRGEQISAMLRPVLERLVIEITRTLSYYTKTFKVPTNMIDELYLTGGGSRLRNIDKFLLYNLPGLKRVEGLNTLKAVRGWADTGVFKQELVVEQAAPHLAVVFGLCLGGGGKINLLPLKEVVEQKTIFFSNLLRATFPVLLGVVLSFYALSYGNALNYRVLINRINADIARIEPTAKSVREYNEIKSKLEERRSLLQKAKGKQPLWWGLFKELSNITPKDVVMQKMSVEQGEPKKIRLIGKIIAKYTIVDLALSQYIMVLGDSPYFSTVQLILSKTDMYSPVPAATFEIVCQLSY